MATDRCPEVADWAKWQLQFMLSFSNQPARPFPSPSGGLPWLWCAAARGNGRGSAVGKGTAAETDLLPLAAFVWSKGKRRLSIMQQKSEKKAGLDNHTGLSVFHCPCVRNTTLYQL